MLSFNTMALLTKLGSVNSTYAYLQAPISVLSFTAKLLPGSEHFCTASEDSAVGSNSKIVESDDVDMFLNFRNSPISNSDLPLGMPSEFIQQDRDPVDGSAALEVRLNLLG